MRNFGVIEDDAILEFAGVAEHHTISDDHVFADITATPYFAVISDPGGTFDGRSVLDHRATSDVDILTYERAPHHPGVNSWFQPELQIAANLLQDIPDLDTIIENGAMLCLVKIEKIRRAQTYGGEK